eukprot:TRINITY_DN1599_c0_g1_i7.p2 TRINITY_DN1599_c0_g1~~TRINITY_DN1599_c0_g1_i7.p2  ORF type:complete len:225 (+),score=44.99 TRINITY_DN1599_c0_g1_i7:1577-2251(+)
MKRPVFGFLLFFFALGLAQAPCVAFRLDDTQDDWMVSVQKAVMGALKRRGVPLTIGVVPKLFGNYPGSEMLQYVKENLEDPTWDLEVAAHGWDHTDFAGPPYTELFELIGMGKEKLMDVTGLPDIETFIPPFNGFSERTLEALKDHGFTIISSGITHTHGPCPRTGLDFYQLPQGASTAKSNGETPVVATETWHQIQSQIASDGYAMGESAQRRNEEEKIRDEK